MPERLPITCHCGESIVYDNPMKGAVNIGHFQKTTGWVSLMRVDTCAGISVCPDCYAKIEAHAIGITQILGTSYIHLTAITPKELR